jgi:glucose 1-dehydrogenase
MAEEGSTVAPRVVVVTGSTSGIGRAIAAAFVDAGDDVVVHGRSAERGEAVVADLLRHRPGGSVRLHLADLTDPAACDGLIAFAAAPRDRIDVLVNNAGTDVFTGVLETSLDEWAFALDLDLRAPWLLARAAAPLMPPGSTILNIGSNHANSTLPGSFPYNVAKSGLVALTQSLAIELAPRGIRANVVAPGYIDTPLNDQYFAAFPDPAGQRRHVERIHPVGRMGRVEEVAAAVVYLASPLAAFATGTTLLLDGGRSTLMEDPLV